MTALALGGAQIDPGHFDDFCATGPADKVCDAAPETPDSPHVTQREALRRLGLEAAAARASEGGSFAGLRAILAIAPPVQMLAPASLARITVPTTLIVGDRDPLVPAATEAAVAARAIDGARLVIAPGVAHYSFVATCTPEGRKALGLCAMAPRSEEAHTLALAEAIRLFDQTLLQPHETRERP
jgi:pimeloyl-ACP methyl ester carboxylesterase